MAFPRPSGDVLSYLPASPTVEYRKGNIIYGPHSPTPGIYLVVSGEVVLWEISESGGRVLVEIFRAEEMFGQSSILSCPLCREQATALSHARIMSWPGSIVEDLMMKQPRLAMAMLQTLAQRAQDLTQRIESLATETAEQRLACSLLRLSQRLGVPEKDGAVRMMSLTHQLLSHHAGTSRARVSHYMNRFRKQGYLRYSRHEIVLNRDALATSVAKAAN